MSSSKIIELRELLATKYPAAPRPGSGYLPTGLKRIDAALGGGLPHGSTVEVVCQSGGGGLLLAALVRSTLERRGLMALIDGADSFDYAGVPKAALPRLLWVRGRSAVQAVRAADLLLRDGNLALVVMDLRSNDAREIAKVPASSWHRLQRVVEPSTTAFLVLTRQPVVSAARPRLLLDAHFTLDACQHRQHDLMAASTSRSRAASRSACAGAPEHLPPSLTPCSASSCCPTSPCRRRFGINLRTDTSPLPARAADRFRERSGGSARGGNRTAGDDADSRADEPVDLFADRSVSRTGAGLRVDEDGAPVAGCVFDKTQLADDRTGKGLHDCFAQPKVGWREMVVPLAGGLTFIFLFVHVLCCDGFPPRENLPLAMLSSPLIYFASSA